jgi:hypothetical protein
MNLGASAFRPWIKASGVETNVVTEDISNAPLLEAPRSTLMMGADKYG